MNYVVIFEKSATGCFAYFPDLPGVITTDKTMNEAMDLII